jgi:DNA mismatch repair protein MutS2
LILQALEFDRVAALVAAFARSERGRRTILADRPSFAPGHGEHAWATTGEVATLIASQGTVSFDGLDAASILEETAGRPEELGELARLVALVRRIVEVRKLLERAAPGPLLRALATELPSLEALLVFCQMRIDAAGEILDSASPALASARAQRERNRGAIFTQLEQIRRQHRGQLPPYTVRRERYCLVVPAVSRQSVPGLVLDVSSSGASFFIEPFPVVELNNALAQAIATARAEEERVLAELAAAFHRHADEMLAAAGILQRIDAAQARVLFGKAAGAVLLRPGGGSQLRLVGARHPLLDPTLAELRREVLGETGNTGPVIPLDLEFPDRARLVLLSGPNAGGKTVALKTLGLAALMVQLGIPILADSGSALPELGRVWCHIGDEQNLLSDLSTFSGAMRVTAALLADADASTLVLYDELGSGTDPEEGAALAAALLEELARRGCWTLATAHLFTVAAQLESVPGTANAAMGFDESSARPTYRLELGAPGRSRGLAIARACGVPEGVLERATGMLSGSFLAIDSYLARLHEEQLALAAEQVQLRAAAADARRAALAAEQERETLASEHENLRRRLEEERERLRQRARDQLSAALAELERARERGEMPGKKRLATIRHLAFDLGAEEDTAGPAPFAVGASVRLRGSSTVGSVTRVIADRLELLVGDKRVWVERAACEEVAPPSGALVRPVTVSADEEAPSELMLIGLTQEEAREALERFIDQAMIAGTSRVRVVHGHGTGALRRVVREFFTNHPAVAAFGHPPQFRGGTGVTEVELKG